MPLPATTSISQWERATKRVEEFVRTGRYISAETALLFVGPPKMSDLGGVDTFVVATNDSRANVVDNPFGSSKRADSLYPVGFVEQFALQQFQNVQKMFEIGSRRSYQAGGRVMVTGSLGRVLFNGPSLLRVLYAYYPSVIAMANGKILSPDSKDSVSDAALPSGAAKGVFPAIFFEAGSFSAKLEESQKSNTQFSFFINLMSELFSHPFGMGVVLRDNNNRNYGAFYCEDCMVTSHSFVINSSSSLITEAVNFNCDAAIPMEFSTGSSEYVVVPPVGQ